MDIKEKILNNGKITNAEYREAHDEANLSSEQTANSRSKCTASIQINTENGNNEETSKCENNELEDYLKEVGIALKCEECNQLSHKNNNFGSKYQKYRKTQQRFASDKELDKWSESSDRGNVDDCFNISSNFRGKSSFSFNSIHLPSGWASSRKTLNEFALYNRGGFTDHTTNTFISESDSSDSDNELVNKNLVSKIHDRIFSLPDFAKEKLRLRGVLCRDLNMPGPSNRDVIQATSLKSSCYPYCTSMDEDSSLKYFNNNPRSVNTTRSQLAGSSNQCDDFKIKSSLSSLPTTVNGNGSTNVSSDRTINYSTYLEEEINHFDLLSLNDDRENELSPVLELPSPSSCNSHNSAVTPEVSKHHNERRGISPCNRNDSDTSDDDDLRTSASKHKKHRNRRKRTLFQSPDRRLCKSNRELCTDALDDDLSPSVTPNTAKRFRASNPSEDVPEISLNVLHIRQTPIFATSTTDRVYRKRVASLNANSADGSMDPEDNKRKKLKLSE